MKFSPPTLVGNRWHIVVSTEVQREDLHDMRSQRALDLKPQSHIDGQKSRSRPLVGVFALGHAAAAATATDRAGLRGTDFSFPRPRGEASALPSFHFLPNTREGKSAAAAAAAAAAGGGLQPNDGFATRLETSEVGCFFRGWAKNRNQQLNEICRKRGIKTEQSRAASGGWGFRIRARTSDRHP